MTNTTTATAPASAGPPDMIRLKPPRPQRSKAPAISFFVREFRMPDQRRIMIDKRFVGFATPDKTAPDTQTIVAFRSQVRAVPILASMDEFAAWWLAPAKADKEEAAP